MRLEMPMSMSVNQIRLYIDLSKTQGFSPIEAIDKIREEGYSPEIKYYSWVDELDTTQIEVCALLYNQVPEDPGNKFDELQREWDLLSGLFGSEAVNLVWGTQE